MKETHCHNCLSSLSPQPSTLYAEDRAPSNAALVNAMTDKYLQTIHMVQLLEDKMRKLDEREPLTVNESERFQLQADKLDDKRLLLIALRNSLFATLTLLKIAR